MEIRVLGPVEAWHRGRSLYLARRQQRLILGILALDANKLVTSDRLIDLLWGEQLPAHARAVLQSRVSELRTALTAHQRPDADATLLTRGNGYVLAISPEQVDAHQFRLTAARTSEMASDDEARRSLRKALALWRGPVLGGQLTEGAYAALCQGLEAERLTTAEDLFEIELRLGNHLKVVDELGELATAHPSRERLVVQRLLALHRAGRTAQALHEYDRWRRWLADDLGIDPGTEVQQLHLAILRGDLALTLEARPSSRGPDKADEGQPSRPHDGALPAEGHDAFDAAVPRILPPDIADFTGRAAEIALLTELLVESDRKRVAVAAVTGPAGVGKTALSVHVAYRLIDHFPDGQLYVNLRGFDTDTAADPFEVAGRFLRALGVDGAAVPDTLDERVDLYRDLLSQRRVIVVLDNAASEDQVAPLIPSGTDCAVVITSRVRLGPLLGAQMVGLDVLTPAEALHLLARIAGTDRIEAEPAGAADLCRQCGYLPLALRVAAAKLVTKPHWKINKLVRLLDDERSRLGQLSIGHLDVRASINLSYDDLDSSTRRLLCQLGDIDLPEINLWVAAALCDAPHMTAEIVLEHLFDAQLLDIAGQEACGDPRYRMHDLVRLFARDRAQYDEPAEVTAGRTRVYGAWLRAADVSYRAIFGGDHQNIRGTAARRTIDDQVTKTLVNNPLQWFEVERHSIVAVVRNAARDRRSSICWELVCTTSPLFQMRRYFDEWRELIELALGTARAESDDIGEAAMLYRLGMALTDQTKHAEARSKFVRAAELFEEVDDRHGQATVGTYLGMIERFMGNEDLALEHYEKAAPVLRDAGDHGGEAFALRGIAQICTARGQIQAADAHFHTALDLYRMCACRQGEAQVLFWQSMLRLKQGRNMEAKAGFESALDIVRVIGDRAGEAQCLRGIALSYQHQGDRILARTTLLEALQIAHQPRPTLTEVTLRNALAELDQQIG